MFCKYCGQEIRDEAVICPHCGREQNKRQPTAEKDESSAAFAVLGFFFPIVGLILYLVWMNDFPLRAKSAGKGALINVIVGVVMTILFVILIFVLMAMGISISGSYYSFNAIYL